MELGKLMELGHYVETRRVSFEPDFQEKTTIEVTGKTTQLRVSKMREALLHQDDVFFLHKRWKMCHVSIVITTPVAVIIQVEMIES